MSDDPTDARADPGEDETEGDTFGVGIAVDAEAFRFVVHVPSDIDSGWRDPEAFQTRVETETWERLDKRETLHAVDERAGEGETVTLGTVTMHPDEGLVDHSLSVPGPRGADGAADADGSR
ncbi:hypothetical protein [Candidatus Halobonum tyrrellensis]|uniref:DUF8124 domain-containing protein n=1 Tax=Candidatus Halobonum tyrrellensis G22 TaxID=1324957 RepID=V4HB24_9EURY|nr:hypothetical protein [Candidatus Halobonum tyrrellensis]ESP87253.1 hypothetical protein K933_15349 [Candidatus Halobonum tyrrellensis G22]